MVGRNGNLSRRAVLRSIGIPGLVGLNTSGSAGTATTSTPQSDADSSSGEIWNAAGAKRPVWGVQQAAHDSHRAGTYGVRENNITGYLTIYYLGARWTGTNWIHEFVLGGVGFSWTEYLGSNLEQTMTSELTEHELDVALVDGELEYFDSTTQFVPGSTLEEQIETEVSRDELAATLTAGDRQPGDVDWDGLNSKAGEQVGEIAYERRTGTRHQFGPLSIATGTPIEPVGDALVNFASEDRYFDYISDHFRKHYRVDRGFWADRTTPRSYVQAHYASFELIAAPDESGTIEVTSGFATTDGGVFGMFARNDWARNTIEITIDPLSRPDISKAQGYQTYLLNEDSFERIGYLRRQGAAKPATEDEDIRGTILDVISVDYTPPDDPKEGNTYATNQEIPLDDTTADDPGIIDSGWICGTNKWTGSVGSESLEIHTEGPIEMIYWEKWIDGQTREYHLEFEIDDDEQSGDGED